MRSITQMSARKEVTFCVSYKVVLILSKQIVGGWLKICSYWLLRIIHNRPIFRWDITYSAEMRLNRSEFKHTIIAWNSKHCQQASNLRGSAFESTPDHVEIINDNLTLRLKFFQSYSGFPCSILINHWASPNNQLKQSCSQAVSALVSYSSGLWIESRLLVIFSSSSTQVVSLDTVRDLILNRIPVASSNQSR
jgi:hypothetical protein